MEHELVAGLEAELQELAVHGPVVAVLMASEDDRPVMDPALQTLRSRGVETETRVFAPYDEDLERYAAGARGRGLRVIIAGASLCAGLAASVAARTDLPVIGVPLTSVTSVGGGLDALLSVAQTPAGLPVACVGVDNARNAALLAVRILQA